MTFLDQIRYLCWDKTLMPGHHRLARLRLFYWCVIRQNVTEMCQYCGRPVRLVFHVPDDIWETITGNARDPSGEAGAGVLCIVCVNDLFRTKDNNFLRWTCRTDDSVMVG